MQRCYHLKHFGLFSFLCFQRCSFLAEKAVKSVNTSQLVFVFSSGLPDFPSSGLKIQTLKQSNATDFRSSRLSDFPPDS